MLYAVCSLVYIQPHTTGACKHCLGCSQFVVTQQELQPASRTCSCLCIAARGLFT